MTNFFSSQNVNNVVKIFIKLLPSCLMLYIFFKYLDVDIFIIIFIIKSSFMMLVCFIPAHEICCMQHVSTSSNNSIISQNVFYKMETPKHFPNH